MTKIDRSIVILCCVIVGLGLVIPWISLSTFYEDSSLKSSEQHTLANTPFANLAANKSNIFFEGELMNAPGRPSFYEIRRKSVEPGESITEEAALNVSRQFLEETRPQILNWSLQSTADELDSFRFSFFHQDFRSFVSVNKLSGRVTDFSCRYLHLFDPVRLSKEEGEQIALSFLESQDYHLPPNAIYLGDRVYDCGRYKRFVFQQYVGDVRIESSKIVIAVSSFSKRISDFEYHWFDSTAVSLSGIRERSSVMASISFQLLESPNLISQTRLRSLQYTRAELILVEVEKATNATIYRMSWILELSTGLNSTDEEITLSVDALSSVLYGFRSNQRGVFEIRERSTVLSTGSLNGLAVLTNILAVSIILVPVLLIKRNTK